MFAKQHTSPVCDLFKDQSSEAHRCITETSSRLNIRTCLGLCQGATANESTKYRLRGKQTYLHTYSQEGAFVSCMLCICIMDRSCCVPVKTKHPVSHMSSHISCIFVIKHSLEIIYTHWGFLLVKDLVACDPPSLVSHVVWKQRLLISRKQVE